MEKLVSPDAGARSAVAFLIFNRPECTRQTFAAIRAARPPRLLVIADGPRPDRLGEAERCETTRAIVTGGVDWPCQVEENFSSVNLGCRKRVSSGLDWVFSREEEAIILEDDCLPHASFFPYCTELLDRYREDRRVMMIAGANLAPPASASASYRFSRVCHIWGWASWRRAWEHYDVEMRHWPEFRDAQRMRDVFSSAPMSAHWSSQLEQTYTRRLDTWDYQWCFASFAQNGVNIVPQVNLVSNIGHSAEATHTTNSDHPHANLPAREMNFPLEHPAFVLADGAADQEAVLPGAFTPRWKQVARKALHRLAARGSI